MSCGRSGVLAQLAHDVASAVVAGLGMLRVGRRIFLQWVMDLSFGMLSACRQLNAEVIVEH
jgi:hypothetical protein